MGRVAWQDRVVVDGQIHHGEPCIRGTRIPVRFIVGSLADGMEPHEIVKEYPQLGEEDVLGALSYAAELLRNEAMIPLAPTASNTHQGR